MQRSPGGRHAAIPEPAEEEPRRNRKAPRFKFAAVAAVVFAVAGASLAVGLGLKPTALTSRDTAAPPAGSTASSLAEAAKDSSRHPGLEPAFRALVTSGSGSHAKTASGHRRSPSRPSPTSSSSTLEPSSVQPSSVQSSTPWPTTAPSTRAPTPQPSSPSTPAPTPTNSDPGSAPTPTAEYQTPKGANELAWSEAILTQLGAPLTDANIESIGYWMQNEAGSPPSGIVGANNPVNVSEPGYGGTPIKSEGGGYSLYSYPDVTDGVDATAAYLARPSYTEIVAALKAGRGLSSSSLGPEFSVYSGGGYTTVPDAWGASQGVPETP